MKKIFHIAVLALLTIASTSYANIEGARFEQSEEAVQNATYGHIDAKGLKALLDSQTPFVLLDARGDKWNDNTIIPTAQLASYEYSFEQVESIIPNSESLVVVYCFSFNCPLSGRLADKLVEWGYTNVIEYPAGLKEWRDVANYPVESIE